MARRHAGPMVGLRCEHGPVLWLTGEHRVLCRKRHLDRGAARQWTRGQVGHFARARELRRDSTPAEQRLWPRLRRAALGAKFRRQHPLGPFIVDFYCFERGLVVEVDGDSHYTPEGLESDSARDTYLAGLGLDVLHVTNAEVHDSLEAVVEAIEEADRAAEPIERGDRCWRRADTLQVGDIIYHGPHLEPAELTAL
ncbi:MAG: endonuclease domain-containing protein, partial [Fimbriimonadaceae bacterium]|nr:endonuclease domain-containing protein [Fimbriimonadaceae bacterium]